MVGERDMWGSEELRAKSNELVRNHQWGAGGVVGDRPPLECRWRGHETGHN